MAPDFASMFQKLVEKIRNDPKAFEKRRREIIEGFINEAPPEYQPGLRRLQAEIEKLRSELPSEKLSCQLITMAFGNLAKKQSLLKTLTSKAERVAVEEISSTDVKMH